MVSEYPTQAWGLLPTANPTTVAPMETVVQAVERTAAPSTAPVTETPSQAPSTMNPSQAPVTETPSQAPVTEAPSQAPVTETPSQAPVTEAPSQAPVTEAPSQAPVTEAPTLSPTDPPTTPLPTPPPTLPVLEEVRDPDTQNPTFMPIAITTSDPTTAPTSEPTTSEPTTGAPTTTEPTSGQPTLQPTLILLALEEEALEEVALEEVADITTLYPSLPPAGPPILRPTILPTTEQPVSAPPTLGPTLIFWAQEEDPYVFDDSTDEGKKDEGGGKKDKGSSDDTGVQQAMEASSDDKGKGSKDKKSKDDKSKYNLEQPEDGYTGTGGVQQAMESYYPVSKGCKGASKYYPKYDKYNKYDDSSDDDEDCEDEGQVLSAQETTVPSVPAMGPTLPPAHAGSVPAAENTYYPQGTSGPTSLVEIDNGMSGTDTDSVNGVQNATPGDYWSTTTTTAPSVVEVGENNTSSGSGESNETVPPTNELPTTGENNNTTGDGSSTGTDSGTSGTGSGGVTRDCNFCDDPNFVPDGNVTVDGVSCANWQIVAWTNPPYEDCVLLRATAVGKCGCPVPGSPPTGSISGPTSEEPMDPADIICTDICSSVVARQVQNYRKLPNSELTCSDVLSLPAVDGAETCRIIEETYGYWCGCPGFDAPCTLCESGLPPSRPNSRFIRSSETCRSIADTLQVVPSSRCEGYRTNLLSNLGYDAAAFCGCLDDEFSEQGGSSADGGAGGTTSTGNDQQGSPVYTVCETPCPEGTTYMADSDQGTMIVPDWNAPCSEWPNRLPFVTNQSLCQEIQNVIVGPFCCEVTSGNNGGGSSAINSESSAVSHHLFTTGQAVVFALGLSAYFYLSCA